MVQIRYGLVSITGNYRDNNEDSGTADSHGRFFVVADGMGGQAAGEKASQLATEIFPEVIQQKIDFDSDPPDKVRKVLDDAVAQANGEIIALGEVEPQYHQMGTTIVFLVHAAGRFYIGGVGDSRCYRLRGGKMERLTTDHSLTEALKDAGTITEDEAKTHRYKNVLYRYLGTKEGGAGTDPKDFEPQSGDRYILCTDGVTDGMEEPPLKAELARHDDPRTAAESIVKAAEAGGSKDNITCLVVYVD